MVLSNSTQKQIFGDKIFIVSRLQPHIASVMDLEFHGENFRLYGSSVLVIAAVISTPAFPPTQRWTTVSIVSAEDLQPLTPSSVMTSMMHIAS